MRDHYRIPVILRRRGPHYLSASPMSLAAVVEQVVGGGVGGDARGLGADQDAEPVLQIREANAGLEVHCPNEPR